MSNRSTGIRATKPLWARWIAAVLGVIFGGVLSAWLGFNGVSFASLFNVLSLAYLVFVAAIPATIGFVLVLFRPRLGPLVRWFLLSALTAGLLGLTAFHYQQSRELMGTIQLHLDLVGPVDWSGSAECITTEHYSNAAISEVQAYGFVTLDGQPVWVHLMVQDPEGNPATSLHLGQPMNEDGSFVYREYASDGRGLTVSTSGSSFTGRMDFTGMHGGPVPFDIQGKPLILSGHVTWSCSYQDYHPS